MSLGDLTIRLPPFGDFAKLSVMRLTNFRLDTHCDLGDVVSSERCLLLQQLTLCNPQGLSNVAIDSKNLLIIELAELEELQQLTISAPMLGTLRVVRCRVTAAASHLCSGVGETWSDGWNTFRDSTSLAFWCMYAPPNLVSFQYQDSMSLLQHFKAAPNVERSLIYPSSMVDCQFLMENMNTLPAIEILSLRPAAAESTGVRHTGQVPCDDVSHSSMHPVWNRCVHAGSCFTTCPRRTSPRQIAHSPSSSSPAFLLHAYAGMTATTKTDDDDDAPSPRRPSPSAGASRGSAAAATDAGCCTGRVVVTAGPAAAAAPSMLSLGSWMHRRAVTTARSRSTQRAPARYSMTATTAPAGRTTTSARTGERKRSDPTNTTNKSSVGDHYYKMVFPDG
uniref:Uncharacterized protein n=1 Tax=Oryza punctata TaxID=4537 RepID=A0A0E0LCA8_ORYPU